MRIVMGTFMLLALAGCTSSKEAYKSGCKAGILLGLESVGIDPGQVDPTKVADACTKLEADSGKKSQ